MTTMVKTNGLTFWFLAAIIQATVRGKANTEVNHILPVTVCEGETIPLVWNSENVNSDIKYAKYYKHGKANHKQIFYLSATTKEIYMKRAHVFSGTNVEISNAQVNDSGLYISEVAFHNETGHLKFNVTVIKGCPNNADFYDPVINYKLDKDAWERLPVTKSMELRNNSLLILKISVPKGDPPVTCSINGIKCGASGQAEDCLVALEYKRLGEKTISINMQFRSKGISKESSTHISINVLAAINASQDHTDSLRPLGSTNQEPQEEKGDYGEEIVIILVVVLVIVVLGFVMVIIILVVMLDGIKKKQIKPRRSYRDYG